jgi:hypothetical protein
MRIQGNSHASFIEGVKKFLQGFFSSGDAIPTAALMIGFVFVFPVIFRFFIDRKLRLVTSESARSERRRQRIARRIGPWVVLLLIAALLLSISVPSTRLKGHIFLTIMGAIGGMPLLILGLKSRIGPFLTCARCGYRMSSWRRAKDPCPECGNLWKQPWGASLGVPGIRWNLVAWGVGMQLASLLAMVWLISRLP